ncbi:hypothetical protein F2841_10680 [Bacteroides fragilis]|uniref:Uncharacterized protein n=1 Tax=Bacteroides fragilis TaxID=817 RepID=A0A395WLP5_BACFG|nr:hypothetical protein VU15_01130 [Bacteroides fragilis]KAA4698036.1 hypothetical protein F3B26_19780 [Bacteroides fragilis]KAA4702272.1 hypothetical protein F3B28_02770 [Bacteroides fragilis]KAA4710841.1 hypothetical protein F3B27_04725 [Bacteroides fragilis]KAA4720420.1 hypothetical protein F3B32_06380 [Bacteroides fragilis]
MFQTKLTESSEYKHIEALNFFKGQVKTSTTLTPAPLKPQHKTQRTAVRTDNLCLYLYAYLLNLPLFHIKGADLRSIIFRN